MNPTLTFKMATLQDEMLVKEWWAKPHVMEFWGAPEAHFPNFEGYIQGNKDIFDYWIGAINNEPYCLLCTSNCTTLEEEGDWYGQVIKDHISKPGKVFSLDILIGNENYLGKGLAVPTINAFINFVKAEIDSKVSMFIIDPEVANQKAVYLYQKAGFRIATEFIAAGGKFVGKAHYLMIREV